MARKPVIWLKELRTYGILIQHNAHYSTVQYMRDGETFTESVPNDEIEARELFEYESE